MQGSLRGYSVVIHSEVATQPELDLGKKNGNVEVNIIYQGVAPDGGEYFIGCDEQNLSYYFRPWNILVFMSGSGIVPLR